MLAVAVAVVAVERGRLGGSSCSSDEANEVGADEEDSAEKAAAVAEAIGGDATVPTTVAMTGTVLEGGAGRTKNEST
jgi:hypothetical protein